jgi:hypothetical protein
VLLALEEEKAEKVGSVESVRAVVQQLVRRLEHLPG